MRSFYKFSNVRPFSSKVFTPKVESKFKTLISKSFLKKKADLVISEINALVTPSLVGQRVLVYNGLTLNGFLIRRSMVGVPFYQLVRTKKIGYSIHTDKKVKKKKLK
jgi:ribosomal protein S19